jgi:UDP-N-acetylmuramoyl-tripeptide--D-alanyl-D-alanine ligase
LARRVINRYQPIVIGITGSAGKTFTKDAVHHVLSRKFWVRKNNENYNNELGVPLAVLGIDPGLSAANFLLSSWRKVISFWPKFFGGLWLAYGFPKQNYPKMLVLELAADKPGDINYLTGIVKPQVGIVTVVGDMPVHVEFYASPQAVAEEKSKLIEQLPVHDGLAILNYDDQTVLDMKEKTKAKIMTFGFYQPSPPTGGSGAGPDVWVSDTAYFAADDDKSIGGLSFKINHGNTFVPARINNLIGVHQLYGPMAAVAAGLHFGMNLVDICGTFENVELPKHRMSLVSGIKDTAILDDSYNASPIAMHAALDTLRDFAKARDSLSGANPGRKIAVLGDMRELGKYEIEAHRAIGNLVGERADILITVGAAAKFIADSAANQMKPDFIFSFNTSDEAKVKVQEIIQEGDIILVKGSHSMEMIKIVEEITAR